MLKILRRIAAILFLLGISLLFVDFTATTHKWLGWMAKVQFLPAVLSLNALVIILLLVLTLVFGRLYCSVICPLGVMQDGFAWLGKRAKPRRYSYSKPKNILRYSLLILMVITIVVGIPAFVSLLAPYSAYGRIASSFLAPVWAWINNIFAGWAENNNSYAFYRVEAWRGHMTVVVVAGVTLLTLAILAWRNGRTYCNTICPVGTVLGFVSRWSWLKPLIDTTKCNGCGACARQCKAACIDSKEHKIDYSRCVTCFDCVGACRQGAIKYAHKAEEKATDTQRRGFVAGAAFTGIAAAAHAAEKTVDGGLAVILDKEKPNRKTRIVPAGALSLANVAEHCTACQLCITACPNGVLRPSTNLTTFMQPEASYEVGYCRPECTRCSDVCPTGAIRPIDLAEKSSIQTGHAVWVKANCVPLTEGLECGNCARHCPAEAITMVPSVRGDEESVKIPAINTARCIGCGACENLCPSRPFSAIYVEGHRVHKTI